jgi:hypothetical protein
MRLRLTSIDEYQFLTCLKHSLWGSKSARFKDWQIGDYLAFIVNKALAGLAEVAGDPFMSKEIVWDNGLFTYRIPIKFVNVMAREQRVPLLGEVRDAIISSFGTRYGLGILAQQLLVDRSAETVVTAIRARPNSLAEFQLNIERLLQEARQEREKASLAIKKPRRIQPQEEIPLPSEEPVTKKEMLIHSETENNLVKLGKIAGYSVWIAPNDRNRPFRGKRLGEGCLKSLPNLGLSEEATRRISLIDIIWIKQNAPVCAFEVESTTSIYSGLLRMSDLLSVVPALNIKLYVVAPENRQERFKAELGRPTFQRIGLSDFCQFIPAGKLSELLSKVKDLEGHVRPTIADSIATGFEEPIEGLT